LSPKIKADLFPSADEPFEVPFIAWSSSGDGSVFVELVVKDVCSVISVVA
jgi:hypothetical protein